MEKNLEPDWDTSPSAVVESKIGLVINEKPKSNPVSDSKIWI